ncbi:MAG: hypothetical protein PW792_00305 [Acidobacteriaceae bacterium]|nr:hypothetical protein [Acidobacteriaceae bacterium]
MSETVRKTSADPLLPEALERLRKLADKPDAEVDTSDIPERSFDLELAAKRRREGWRPGASLHRKAS